MRGIIDVTSQTWYLEAGLVYRLRGCDLRPDHPGILTAAL